MSESYLESLKVKNIKKLGVDELENLKLRTKDYRNKKNQVREYQEGQLVEQIYNNIADEMDRYGHRRNNIVKYGYECKFASHLIRLLCEGIEFAETGKLEFPLKKADKILLVKEGKVNLAWVLGFVEGLRDKLRELEPNSKIRRHPDSKRINKLLIKIIDEYFGEIK